MAMRPILANLKNIINDKYQGRFWYFLRWFICLNILLLFLTLILSILISRYFRMGTILAGVSMNLYLLYIPIYFASLKKDKSILLKYLLGFILAIFGSLFVIGQIYPALYMLTNMYVILK